MLNLIKQSDVSKNKELTKERVDTLWKSLDANQRLQIKAYDISLATVKRTRDLGNISVKVASALAIVCGVDPYYLTAETDENNIQADENRIRDFISNHGYGKVLDVKDDNENNKTKKIKEKIANEPQPQEPELESELIPVPVVETFEPPAKQVDLTIEEFAEMQMKSLSDEKKELLFNLSDDDVQAFVQTLTKQSAYSDRAKNLLGLLRLILIR